RDFDRRVRRAGLHDRGQDLDPLLGYAVRGQRVRYCAGSIAPETLDAVLRNRLVLDERLEQRAVVRAPLAFDDASIRRAAEIGRDGLPLLGAQSLAGELVEHVAMARRREIDGARTGDLRRARRRERDVQLDLLRGERISIEDAIRYPLHAQA